MLFPGDNPIKFFILRAVSSINTIIAYHFKLPLGDMLN